MKYFTKSHEWLEIDGDSATVGITAHAQELLGDVVFVETPELEAELAASEVCASIESVKAASDIYAPVTGSVTEVNPALEATPELVNESPEAGGWLFKMTVADSSELANLLDADAYQALVDSEG